MDKSVINNQPQNNDINNVQPQNNDINNVQPQTVNSDNSFFTNSVNNNQQQTKNNNQLILGKFKSIEDLAKSYQELEAKIGRDKVALPVDEKEYPEFLKKIGAPEDIKGYKDFEDASTIFENQESYQAFKETARKAGLLPYQYERLYESLKETIYQQRQVESENRQSIVQQGVAILQKEWGEEFNSKIELSKQVFNDMPDSVKQQVIQAGLDVNPDFVRFLAHIGENYKEDSLVSAKYSYNDAKQELSRILENKNHPYYDKHHPEHDIAVKKVNELYSIVYK